MKKWLAILIVLFAAIVIVRVSQNHKPSTKSSGTREATTTTTMCQVPPWGTDNMICVEPCPKDSQDLGRFGCLLKTASSATTAVPLSAITSPAAGHGARFTVRNGRVNGAEPTVRMTCDSTDGYDGRSAIQVSNCKLQAGTFEDVVNVLLKSEFDSQNQYDHCDGLGPWILDTNGDIMGRYKNPPCPER